MSGKSRRSPMKLMTSLGRYFASRASARCLSQMDNARLSDLGLNRYDLFEARRMGLQRRSEFFSHRRDQRADAWLR